MFLSDGVQVLMLLDSSAEKRPLLANYIYRISRDWQFRRNPNIAEPSFIAEA